MDIRTSFCVNLCSSGPPMLPLGADMLEAVQKGDVEQCARIVREDHLVLACRGWGGLTPLHYAALQGNRLLVDLFLSHGADCNTPCQAGQTPFHFASRQGNVYIMHQMLQHGANLRIADLQGKTAFQHAVSGGSVVAVQYLSETKMFSFSDTDNFLIGPLHLAASTGNVDMVKYLLKNNRCSADAADHQGATALHVAAERGAVEVSWLLMRQGGLSALHMCNHNGLTPLDLCQQGATFRHQQLRQMFMKFISVPTDHRPEEPHGMYYWALLFPSLSGGAIFLTAVLLGGYGGILCVLLFPWLAKCIFTQYHRMSSYQRFPNPVYLGTLAAGILHSLMCFYIKILPNIQHSDLLLHVSVIHFSLVLWLFWRLLTKNPGHMRRTDADHRFCSIADLVEANESLSRFCIECEMFQPDGCKHCRLCTVCVLEYDHHCLFIGRCVGRDNRRLFLFFLLAMVVAHAIFLLTALQYLFNQLGSAPQATWGTEAWVLALVVMNLITALWESWLLREQLQALAMGTTTYFKHPPYPLRPPRQRWGAIISFLMEGRLNWDQMRTSSVDV